MKDTLKIIPIFTCEHATNYIPISYQRRLKINNKVLDSHKGWDPGAKKLCQIFANKFYAPAFYGKTSRLLIDLNRSSKYKKCFSDYSKHLDKFEKELLLKKYYNPFRNDVNTIINALIANNPNAIICHISVHSFTPVLSKLKRNNDIGILYDPKRLSEKVFANLFKNALAKNSEDKLLVRMNYPYKGVADGHTTHLRKLFPSNKYIGIELEINQKLINTHSYKLDRILLNIITKSFNHTIAQFCDNDKV